MGPEHLAGAAAADGRRYEVLRRLELLDTPEQEVFERITRVVARLLDVPVALISLVDLDRQFFLSQVGLAEPWASRRETPLSHSFCKHVAANNSPLVTADARLDTRLADNLAIPDLGVIAYAGMPLIAQGECIGSLCAIDLKPREWTEAELHVLRDMSGIAAREFALRAALIEHADIAAELRDSEARFRLAFAGAAVGLVCLGTHGEQAGRFLHVNDAYCRFVGYTEDELRSMHVDDVTHPDDRGMTAEALRELACGEATHLRRWEKRYRRSDGRTVWGMLSTSVVRPEAGQHPYLMSVIEDVTDVKRAQADMAAVAGVIHSVVAGEDVRQAIVEAAVDVAEAASAQLLEPDRPDQLVITACAGSDFRGLRVPLDRPSATAEAFRTGEEIFVSDTAESTLVSRALLDVSGSGALMWQPIVLQGRIVGLLTLAWQEPREMVAERVRRGLGMLADEVALALAHQSLLDELARRASRDPLTDLPNRRHWHERAEREMVHARRSGEPLSVALIDLDHFKAFNDEHGHVAGDELLQAFARNASASLRETDTMARWGGEEFAILLPCCPSGKPIDTILARVLNATPGAQTCSIGYATWDGKESIPDLLRRADAALYEAKRGGRNRVSAAPTRALDKA
jgi:diguanylate cyclase (GGDEF)-like protein/PAS domain S-box-containing protein